LERNAPRETGSTVCRQRQVRSFARKACRYWQFSGPAGAGETVRRIGNPDPTLSDFLAFPLPPNARSKPVSDRGNRPRLSVADAQHRHLGAKMAGSADSAWPSITEARPPENTMALGSTAWKGWIFRRRPPLCAGCGRNRNRRPDAHWSYAHQQRR
jgi:hypothetical protein